MLDPRNPQRLVRGAHTSPHLAAAPRARGGVGRGPRGHGALLGALGGGRAVSFAPGLFGALVGRSRPRGLPVARRGPAPIHLSSPPRVGLRPAPPASPSRIVRSTLRTTCSRRSCRAHPGAREG